MPKCSRVTLVLGQETGVTDYPINHLRNAVIGNVFSQFILLIDADFQVSPGLEVRFRETVDLNSVAMKAFVVPAFEWIETGQASYFSNLLPVITAVISAERSSAEQSGTHSTDLPGRSTGPTIPII